MEPTHPIAKAMCGRVTLCDDGVGSEVLGDPRGERPCVISRVSRSVGSTRTRGAPRTRTNQRASGEAQGDVCRCRAHKETRPASHQNPYGIVG
jgi:hypothetical protein